MKVLIDTNVFQYLYTTHREKVAIFDDIKKIESHIFLPEQIIDEFYRNRDTRLSDISATITGLKFKIDGLSSFVCEFQEFEELNQKGRECEDIKKEIIKKIAEIKENPDLDPILIKFKELCGNSNILRADISDEIINKANNRHLRGNPPKSEKSNSIGDEIIWELVLSYVQDDLIIVSEDGTYKKFNTFLKKEFSEKTGKSLIITEKLGDAIKILGQNPSEATEKFDDDNQIRLENIRKAIEYATKTISSSPYNKSSFTPTSTQLLASAISDSFAGLTMNQAIASAISDSFAGLTMNQAIPSAISFLCAGLQGDKSQFSSVLGEQLSTPQSGFMDLSTTANEQLKATPSSNHQTVNNSKEQSCPECDSKMTNEDKCEKCESDLNKGFDAEKNEDPDEID
jgi:predicted nucleic acid-binding protein